MVMVMMFGGSTALTTWFQSHFLRGVERVLQFHVLPHSRVGEVGSLANLAFKVTAGLIVAGAAGTLVVRAGVVLLMLVSVHLKIN